MQGKLSLVAAVAALAVFLWVGAALAAGTTQVSGVQQPTATPGVYTMTGSLIGVWTTTSIVATVITPSGVINGSGTEQFDGCLDADRNGACGVSEPTGQLFFSFTYSTKYDTFSWAEIHGRCHHPVTGGGGDFAGATGVLDFHDDPVTGCASYNGHISLAT